MVTRKIEDLGLVENLSQIKVGEHYQYHGAKLWPDDRSISSNSALLKCIYVDLFGTPHMLCEDHESNRSFKITAKNADWYTKGGRLRHVKVTVPLQGDSWVVFWKYTEGVGGVFGKTFNNEIDIRKSLAEWVSFLKDNIQILSIKKIHWTEGEDERQK